MRPISNAVVISMIALAQINKEGWIGFSTFSNLSRNVRYSNLGAGPGWLWQRNLDRIPEGWEIVLSDFSIGILQETKNNLRDIHCLSEFRHIDAQDVPFEDETFDVVIANNMLYHVPDRPKAFSEICRILRPNGLLYAATIGKAHMKELKELTKQVDPEAYSTTPDREFGLENGSTQLSGWFEDVTLHLHEDSLIVPEVEALFEYVQSSGRMNEEGLRQFNGILQEEIASHGAVHITKAAGMFVARNKRRTSRFVLSALSKC